MTKELLERDLQNLFYNLVRKGGGMCEKMAPTRWGIPDCLVLYPGGRIFLVELKTEKGQLRAAQSLWHEKASQRGTHVVVLHGERATRAWCALQARGQPRRGPVSHGNGDAARRHGLDARDG